MTPKASIKEGTSSELATAYIEALFPPLKIGSRLKSSTRNGPYELIQERDNDILVTK